MHRASKNAIRGQSSSGAPPFPPTSWLVYSRLILTSYVIFFSHNRSIVHISISQDQIFSPTGGAEPPGSGFGKPDWFNRESEKTVEFKIQTKTRNSNSSHRYTGRYRSGSTGNRLLNTKNRISGEFDVFSNLNLTNLKREENFLKILQVHRI
jgi:hypothetical protein